METPYSLDRDLGEARAMAEGLESYVRGGQLYGTVNDGGMFSTVDDMPSLTIGALLLRLRRLQALERQMTPEQKAILTEIEAGHDAVRSDWQEHYRGMLHNEAGARLRSLEAYLAECDGSPDTCAGDYLPEALRRTMLQEIADALHRYHLPEIDLPKTLRDRDVQLRRFTEPSDFIWDAALRVAYPQDKFWWLYERPQVTEREER